MDTISIEAPTYSFVGGNLSIDFTNTVGSRGSGEVQDKFSGYHDLVTWAAQAAIIDGEAALQALNDAMNRPDEAEAVLGRAVALREALYRIFEAVSHDQLPGDTDMKAFNHSLAEAMRHARLEARADGFDWSWEESRDLDRLLWPVVRSAADLLTSPHELERVKSCGSDTCGWLFVDTSRNASRRWCDMSDCGNRAKARRHYNRVKKGSVE